jgi:hypothetical protein
MIFRKKIKTRKSEKKISFVNMFTTEKREKKSHSSVGKSKTIRHCCCPLIYCSLFRNANFVNFSFLALKYDKVQKQLLLRSNNCLKLYFKSFNTTVVIWLFQKSFVNIMMFRKRHQATTKFIVKRSTLIHTYTTNIV